MLNLRINICYFFDAFLWFSSKVCFSCIFRGPRYIIFYIDNKYIFLQHDCIDIYENYSASIDVNFTDVESMVFHC